jgi:YidC/Oxa1 family membrane protein insertase
MWPLIKKQIHQTRVMQKVAPEVKKIRAQSKGSKDRAILEKVNRETMEVYRKHGISPFSSIGTLIVQLPLFIAIYSAVRTAFSGTHNLANLLYGPVKDLSYVKEVLASGGRQITTFADWADLARRPFANNEVYVPVLIVAITSIIIQFLQVRQTLPPKNTQTDDPNEKLQNSMPYIMVLLFGWISLSVEGAISFYLASGALVAIFQQYFILQQEKHSEVVQAESQPTVKVLTAKEAKLNSNLSSESKSAEIEKTTKSIKASQPKSKPSSKNNPKKSSTKKKNSVKSKRKESTKKK